MARIEALLRRVATLKGNTHAISDNNIIERGPMRLDVDRLTVSWKGQKINLTLTQFWIVKALSERPGHIRSYDQLMDAASIVVTPNTISAHIKTIRGLFKEADDTFDAIQTVRGIGYRWHSEA